MFLRLGANQLNINVDVDVNPSHYTPRPLYLAPTAVNSLSFA